MKGYSPHMFLPSKHMLPLQLNPLRIFPISYSSDCAISYRPEKALDSMWSYLARKACSMNRTDEVSWTVTMLRGMQEVLSERTEMKVNSPRLWAGCHKWTDRRITWNLNWFLWEGENEISDICWPHLMEYVTSWIEPQKEFRQAANATAGKDDQCLLKSAIDQLLLLTHLSVPAQCRLNDSTSNEYKKVFFF